jgi:hypothetical protein
LETLRPAANFSDECGVTSDELLRREAQFVQSMFFRAPRVALRKSTFPTFIAAFWEGRGVEPRAGFSPFSPARAFSFRPLRGHGSVQETAEYPKQTLNSDMRAGSEHKALPASRRRELKPTAPWWLLATLALVVLMIVAPRRRSRRDL